MENVSLVLKPVSYTRIQEASPLPPVSRKLTPPTTGASQDPSLGVKFASAGIAACIGDLVSFPLDTAKVRLQIQGEGGSATTGSSRAVYRGLVGTVCTISRQEGPRALYNGLVPGLQRQLCFASVRIGLYDSVKETYASKLQAQGTSGTHVGVRLLAGVTTGGLAVMCAQPTDVVKVRFQAQMAGEARYSGVFQAYQTIAAKEGIKGLWKGMMPNIARNSVVNCSELVTYDIIKDFLLHSGILRDSMPCHFLSAFGAGFATTLVASPIDVVKTRFMNSPPGQYSGVINCAIVMARKEGAAAFYKGFMPSFMRMAIWNITMFVCYEQLKKNLTQRTSPMPKITIDHGHKTFL